MKRSSLICALLLAACSIAPAQNKKRVAVLDFDYATVRSASAALFGTDRDIGKGIADIMVEKLVNGGVYSVIERAALDKVLTEQNFSNSDRANASTAAKIGQVLGVDAIIIGSITQFGSDDKSTSVGGGAVGRIGGRFGLGGVQRRESKAVVNISVRMVSTSTAEILMVANGRAESNRSGTSLLGSGGSSAGAGLGGVDMTTSNFRATLIGEATHEAVGEASGQLQQKAASIPVNQIDVEGQVADVAGETLILNVGSKAGLQVGAKLLVQRKVREVRDPASGKVIRAIVDKLGEVVITEVDEVSSVGKFTGSNPPKVGDQVSTQ